MIVVDTSVWIEHFRNNVTPTVIALRGADASDIIVGDLILLECLQGARDDRHASKIEAALGAFNIEEMLDSRVAVDAARNYRALRSLGLTPRKTIDIIIGTFCIKRGYKLLHKDQDFEPMAKHLGLQVVI